MDDTYIIPVSSGFSQNFVITLPFRDENRKFIVDLDYREIGEYWTITLTDYSTKEILVSNLPLVRGANAKYSGNLLNQYKYKRLGALYVIKLAETDNDIPTLYNIGTEFALVWSDNNGYD